NPDESGLPFGFYNQRESQITLNSPCRLGGLPSANQRRNLDHFVSALSWIALRSYPGQFAFHRAFLPTLQQLTAGTFSLRPNLRKEIAVAVPMKHQPRVRLVLLNSSPV